MNQLQSGSSAPDLTVMTLDGRSIPPSTAWGNGRSALLVFLRHLG